MKKTHCENNLRFYPEMYNTTVGSLVICYYIFCSDRMESIGAVKRRWKKYVALCLKDKCPIKDETIIKDTIKFFNLPEEDIQVAFVQSKFNALFMPYIKDDKGEANILPIREDGFYPQSYKKAVDIKFVKWGEENGNTEKVI